MSVAVLFALAAEQGCFEDLLTDVTRFDTEIGTVRTGQLAGRTVTTVVTGPGRDAARRAAEAAVTAHRPQLLVTAGFCGGLQPQLPRNAITVADRILAADAAPLELDPSVRAQFDLGRAVVGPWLAVDRIISRAEDKRRLGEQFGAIACEMESRGAAEACAARGVPCLAVRVVSDPVDENLPDDLDPLLQPRSPAGMVGAVLGTLWRRPSSIKDLWRLKEQSLAAADALARYLAALLAQSPPPERLPGAEA